MSIANTFLFLKKLIFIQSIVYNLTFLFILIFFMFEDFQQNIFLNINIFRFL